MKSSKLLYNNLLIIIALFLLNITKANTSEIQKWTFPVDCQSDEERRAYFADILNRKYAKGESSIDVDYHAVNQAASYGYNSAYHGEIEKIFYDMAADLDNPEMNIVIPGCGIGRNVIDLLYKTKHANVVANDILPLQLFMLQDAVDLLNISSERLDIKHGDVIEYISSITNNSVDFYYNINLIHFFKSNDIHKMFKEMTRTLKPNGVIFLAWVGYDPHASYKETLFNDSLIKCRDILYNRYFSDQEDPGYIEKDRYNYASLEQIVKLAKDAGLGIYYAQSLYRTSVGAVIGEQTINVDYKYEPFDIEPRDAFPFFQMALHLNSDS